MTDNGIFKTLNDDLRPCVATIGFFDGVHRGHQFLIANVMEEARKAGLQSLVITFDRHPRQVLSQDYQPRLLTTLERKLQLLSLTGVDNVAVLHFTKEMAGLSAHDFMQQILHDKLNVRELIIGYDNRFGHNRAEGFDDYVGYGKEMGIKVMQSTPFSVGDIKVSSSLTRSFLEGGEVEMAARCLGRPYELSGTVVKGFQQGRKLGFPTANLDTGDSGLLIPKGGVYAVKASIDDHQRLMPAMMDIGTRPTYGGTKLSLETNIFNFHGCLYGKPLSVQFIKRIRDDIKFDSIEALAAQIQKDKEAITKIFDASTR
jgi:riboflavin kinase/FMN adenylyltransferase